MYVELLSTNHCVGADAHLMRLPQTGLFVVASFMHEFPMVASNEAMDMIMTEFEHDFIKFLCSIF